MRSWTSPLLWGIVALATWTALTPVPLRADEAIAERLRELERQVESLTRRLEAVERRSAMSFPASGGGEQSADGVVWSFDAYVNASPFKVSQKQLDQKTGQVSLLLQITAPISDQSAWTRVGETVPLALILRSADGAEARTVFKLARGPRLEPGAYLHVEAQLQPAQAMAARHLVIGRSAGGQAPAID